MAKNQPIFAIFSQKNWIVELQKIAIPVFYHYPQGGGRKFQQEHSGRCIAFSAVWTRRNNRRNNSFQSAIIFSVSYRSFSQTGHQTDEEQERQHEDGKTPPRVLKPNFCARLTRQISNERPAGPSARGLIPRKCIFLKFFEKQSLNVVFKN